ncbi:hypothetical protein MRX96_056153 [Rhipicephalus microplus]
MNFGARAHELTCERENGRLAVELGPAYYKIKIDCNRITNVQDNSDVDQDEIQPAPDVTDLDNPMQAAIALNTIAHTMIFDDGACIITNCVNSDRDAMASTTPAESSAGKAAHSAADEVGLIEGTHTLHVATGDGQNPIFLLFDEYAEELSFLQIYLGIPRRITGPKPYPDRIFPQRRVARYVISIVAECAPITPCTWS